MSGNSWELPKPVFRSSSGSLPSDFEGIKGDVGHSELPIDAPKIADDEILSSLYAPPGDTVAEEVSSIGARVEVKPQPYISEQFTAVVADETVRVKAKPVTSKKGGGVVAVAIAVTLLLVVALLAIAYYLFIRQPPQTTF